LKPLSGNHFSDFRLKSLKPLLCRRFSDFLRYFATTLLRPFPAGQGFVARDYSLQRTRLLHRDGTVRTEFSETFVDFMPDGQGVILYSVTWARYRLYTLDGDLITELPFGVPYHIIPDGTLMALYSDDLDETHLVDFSGQTQAIFEGYFRGFVAEGKALMIYDQDTEYTRLFCVPNS
jgi:hypothetical protein